MKSYTFFLSLILALTSYGQTARKYSNEFLKIGVGARYLGCGSALTASEGDPTSVFYNPAGIAHVESTSVSAMHNAYFAGIANFDYGGIVLPIRDNQAIGLSIIRLGIDNIPNTIALYNPDGTINYDNIKSFSIADMAAFLSFAKKIEQKEGLSVGTNAKIIHRSYGSFASAWGFGIDVGIQYCQPKFKLGLFAQDLTTTFSTWAFSFTKEEKEILRATNNDIPVSSQEITMPSIHLGGQYTFSIPSAHIEISPIGKISIYSDKRNVLIAEPISLDASLGVETKILSTIMVRMGASNFTKATNTNNEEYLSFMPSLGVGIKLGQFDIDYSYNNVANTGIGLYSHVFSGVYRFHKKQKTNTQQIMPGTPNIDNSIEKDLEIDLTPGSQAPNK